MLGRSAACWSPADPLARPAYYAQFVRQKHEIRRLRQLLRAAGIAGLKTGFAFIDTSAYVRKVVRRGAKLIVLDYLQAMQPNADMVKCNSEAQTTFASNTVRDLAVNLGVRFIVVCTENREGDLRYSDAIRYDAW